jgi:FHA domain
MPKMIVSIDGVVIKEVQLAKDRTTLGRRPYNDIVIDNLAVSGEHACVVSQDGEVYIEDLGSTNGTYINGKAVKKQMLQNNDSIEIGKYKIQFINERADQSYDKTMLIRPGMMPQATPAAAAPAQAPVLTSAIKVLSGPAAGREVPLTKVVTTVGKPGTAVAAISRRPNGYVVAMVEGSTPQTVNGTPFDKTPVVLKNGDVIELAGVKMQFVQS